jgi:hypothetical protein
LKYLKRCKESRRTISERLEEIFKNRVSAREREREREMDGWRKQERAVE